MNVSLIQTLICINDRESLSPPGMCICAHEHKKFKKACLFRLNLTLADANASLCNFLCQFPAHESTCKMLLLKSYFTPRVLLKITSTPISSCVFLVPRHFYPLKHIRMCILSNNGTQAIQLFPPLLLSTER